MASASARASGAELRDRDPVVRLGVRRVEREHVPSSAASCLALGALRAVASALVDRGICAARDRAWSRSAIGVGSGTGARLRGLAEIERDDVGDLLAHPAHRVRDRDAIVVLARVDLDDLADRIGRVPGDDRLAGLARDGQRPARAVAAKLAFAPRWTIGALIDSFATTSAPAFSQRGVPDAAPAVDRERRAQLVLVDEVRPVDAGEPAERVGRGRRDQAEQPEQPGEHDGGGHGAHRSHGDVIARIDIHLPGHLRALCACARDPSAGASRRGASSYRLR